MSGIACPACHALDNIVLDSRGRLGNEAIRRRRKCANCDFRFTTVEAIWSPEDASTAATLRQLRSLQRTISDATIQVQQLLSDLEPE